MAELVSVTRENNLLKFEISGGKYGRYAIYDFKDNGKYIDKKKVNSLQKYFSTINKSFYSSSIDKVLEKLTDVRTKNFFKYVKRHNGGCTSFNSMLERFKHYSIVEQWISFLPESYSSDYYPEFPVSEIPKDMKKKILGDVYIMDVLRNCYNYNEFATREKLLQIHKEIGLYDNYVSLNRHTSVSEIIARTSKNLNLLCEMGCDLLSVCKKLIYYQNYEGLSITTAINELVDYIKMNKELNRDNFTKYPRMLRSCHDIISNIYRINQKKKDSIQLNLGWDGTKRPELMWESRDIVVIKESNGEIQKTNINYSVIIPENAEDVIDEGNQQNHCVGSYIERIKQKRSYICFLRVKQEITKSLITLEIRGQELVTALGRQNRSVTDSEREIIENYCKAKNLRCLI